MFTIDPAVTDIKIKEKKPFKVLFSMNVHPVANPEMSLEDARSYVFFCREGRDKASVYIGLHFLPSDRKLFYTHSANPFAEGRLPDMEEEARRFGEDFGAVLDGVDFNRMSEQEQISWINGLEILSDRKKATELLQEPAAAEAAPATSGEQAAAPSQTHSPHAVAVQPVPVPVQPAPIQPAAAAAPVQPAAISAQAQQTAPEVTAEQTPDVPSVQIQVQAPAPATAAPARRPVQSKQPGKAAQPRPGAASEPDQSPQHADDLLEEAVKAGVVKAPAAQLKKHIRSTTGIVSREKEALARLLASF